MICAGGGGIPTMYDPEKERTLTGIEAVTEKVETTLDLTVALDTIESVFTISLWTLLPLILVMVMAFHPFCFFNLINVVLSFVYDLIDFQIKHIQPGEVYEATPEEVRFHGVAGQRTETMTHQDALPA